MANTYNPRLAQTLGAAQAGPGFTDIRGAVEPGIRTFKNIMSLRQQEADKLEAEKKRQENLKANDYRSLGALQTEGVPDGWQDFVNQQALQIKSENKNLVNLRGEIDQFDYMDNLATQQKKIAKLQNSVNSLKEYSANYVDLLENDDLSDSLTADELKTINDIVELKGNPIYKDGEVYFVTEAGKEISMSDLPKLKAKESPLHLEISKGIENLAENAAKSGMFRDSEYYQNKVKKYLDNIKMTGDQAKSLASDFLGMAGRDGNFADVFNALTGGELVDVDGDGDIDEDDYIKSIANIKSDDDFIRRVKEEYKEIALITSDNLKPEYDRVNEAKLKAEQAKGGGSLNKWEFDELMRKRDLQVIAGNLKPISKFLNTQPINKTQTKLLIEYANNKIPGIEIYQNNQTDEDGNLLNPNAYVIEVNGEQKPFIIGETPGKTVDKFIKDLYGFSPTDRLTMFGPEKTENKKTQFENNDSDFSEFKINMDPNDIAQTQDEIAMAQLNKQTKVDSAKNKLLKEQFKEQTKSTIQ